jgi:signal transduction histidine kinase
VAFRDISERLAAEAAARREAADAARLQELAASRARIVAAQDAERRRLGRDLHDGAQQRLVHVLLQLQLVRAALGEDGSAATAAADTALEQLLGAIDELRALAAGIHPAILTNRGLQAAVESLTARAPLPVVADVPPDRWPEGAEAAAYFVIAECLTNVAKHAPGATEARVTVVVRDGWLHVEVADDGPGGAAPAAGSGLRGLEDRVAALGGELAVASPPGGGTRVRATLALEEERSA